MLTEFAFEAPNDAIHIGAAAVTLHQHLVDQLKAPGRLVIFPIFPIFSIFLFLFFPLSPPLPSPFI